MSFNNFPHDVREFCKDLFKNLPKDFSKELPNKYSKELLKHNWFLSGFNVFLLLIVGFVEFFLCFCSTYLVSSRFYCFFAQSNWFRQGLIVFCILLFLLRKAALKHTFFWTLGYQN